MIVLGIETATNRGGLSLIKADETVKVLASTDFEKGNVHGREIAPGISKMCRESGLEVRDIGLVSCDLGPGSYTGLRVGLAHAKSICFALGKPLVGVCSLDAMARQAADRMVGRFCPMIDAKWDEIYFAIYDGVVNIRPPDHATPELIRSILPHEVTVFGDALERWDDKFSGLKRLEKEYWFPDATIVAQTGFERYNRGESADINSIEPIYLRKTEAEKNLERGNERPPSLGRGQPF